MDEPEPEIEPCGFRFPNKINRLWRLILTAHSCAAGRPGMKHPLSDDTIDGIRKCLYLITEREKELAEAAGRPMNERPHYVDEPKSSVVIPIDQITKKRDKSDG